MNKEERKQLIQRSFPVLLTTIDGLSLYAKFDVYNYLINEIKETELLEKIIPGFLETINKLPDLHVDHGTYRAFHDLVHSIKNTELLNKYYVNIEILLLVLLNKIDIVTRTDRYGAFSILIYIANQTSWIEDHFLAFFKFKDKFPDNNYTVFCNLISSIKSTELLNMHYSQIETHLLGLLNSKDKYGRNFGTERYTTLSILLKIAQKTRWIEKYFPTFLETIDKLPDEDYKYRVFYNLIDSIKNTELLNKFSSQIKVQLLAFLKNIDKLSYEEAQYAFSILLRIAQEIGWIEELFHLFLETIDKLHYEHTYYVFIRLIRIAKETGSLEKHYTALLNIFPKLPDINKLLIFNEKYDFYSSLIETIENTDMENEAVFKKWKEKEPKKKN